jgi:hypothetical protein
MAMSFDTLLFNFNETNLVCCFLLLLVLLVRYQNHYQIKCPKCLSLISSKSLYSQSFYVYIFDPLSIKYEVSSQSLLHMAIQLFPQHLLMRLVFSNNCLNICHNQLTLDIQIYF